MTAKTAITNDKPKGEPSLASQIGIIVAMELGKALGRQEADAGREPHINTPKRLAPQGRFLLPAGDRPGHISPEAAKDDQPVTNSGGVRTTNGYLVPNGED